MRTHHLKKMKNRAYKTRLLSTLLVLMMLLTSCGGGDVNVTDTSGTGDETTAEPVTAPPNPEITADTVISADLSVAEDPPLLKKVAMYNAGCINPISNYERDVERLRDLNADALRIDLSIGKGDGTGGADLVSDDYEITELDETTGKYKIVTESLKFDFDRLDSVVKLLDENNVLPYMSWCYIPKPLQKDGDWRDLNTDVTNWREVWEEICYRCTKHYVDLGIDIGYHEIYNEPDLEILKSWGVFGKDFKGFFNLDDFNAGYYNELYEYGVKGILRADPDAVIGGPAFALGDIGIADWTGFLPKVKGKKLPLDFFSFHTYLDGTTWFMSKADRKSGKQNELETVVEKLASDAYYIKTAIHINEFTYLNGETGLNDGRNSSFNKNYGAVKTLDSIMEIAERTSVQWIYWAQYMESTVGDEPYGLIEHREGNVKAPYNAIKIYNDMPTLRYRAEIKSEKEDTDGIKTLVSSEDGRVGVLIWNSGDEKTVAVDLKNAGFGEAVRRVYRIDSENGNYFGKKKSAELVADEIATVSTVGNVWEGNVPKNGVLYITLTDGEECRDFTAWENRTDIAEVVRTDYYYEDRYRGLSGSSEIYEEFEDGVCGSYSHFDRSTFTMYLGMGDCLGYKGKYKGQAHANGAVTLEELPEKLRCGIVFEGKLETVNENTALGVRIDYFDSTSGKYTKSVYLHTGIYNEDRDPNSQASMLKKLPDYPWGTEEAPDVVYEMPEWDFEIDFMKYAPDGWSLEGGRVQISFDMQNTGAGTRAAIKLY